MDWESQTSFLCNTDPTLASKLLVHLHPKEAALLMDAMDPSHQISRALHMAPDQLARIVVEMTPEVQQHFNQTLQHSHAEFAMQLVESMKGG